MSREFEIVRHVELPATPEEVWEAVTTAEGTAGWLFPNEPIERRVGATTPAGTRVTACEAPHHFAVETGERGSDFFNALEFTIEAKEGGTTTLRYVHSGVFTDDWDDQFDAVDQHTDFYLHTLGQYLGRFAGRRATWIGDVPGGIAAPEASATPDGFDVLRRALGVDGAAEGETVRLAPEGLEPLDAVVDYDRPNFLGLRADDALYRFFGRNAFGMPVGMAIHAFGEVDADAVKQTWRDWLARVYA